MRKISFVLLLALGLISFAVSAQESASGILDKAVAKINKNSSAECKFTVKSGNQSLNGSLSVAGKKFKLSTPQGTTWYDGQSMWTANPSSKEITLVNPSAQEVRESNPFEYLNTYKSQYKVFFSKYKSNDSYLIVLNPKAAKSDIKAVQIDIDKKTLLPVNSQSATATTGGPSSQSIRCL